MNITVTEVNDAPVAGDDAATVAEDGSTSAGEVLFDMTDAEGEDAVSELLAADLWHEDDHDCPDWCTKEAWDQITHIRVTWI